MKLRSYTGIIARFPVFKDQGLNRAHVCMDRSSSRQKPRCLSGVNYALSIGDLSPSEHACRVRLPLGMNEVPETAVREFFRSLYQGCTQRLDLCRYYIGAHLGSQASLQMSVKTASCMKIQRIAVGAGALVKDTSLSAITAVSPLSQETPKKVLPWQTRHLAGERSGGLWAQRRCLCVLAGKKSAGWRDYCD